MTYTLTIPNGELDRLAQELQRKVELVRSDVQLAMAEAFKDTVLNNFGPVGEDRPFDWAPLSPAYAKKVGRTYATLQVTGAMKQAVKIDDTMMESADVVLSNADVAYATPHHVLRAAPPGLPTRRVFPIDEANEVTPVTLAKVVNAADEALRRML